MRAIQDNRRIAANDFESSWQLNPGQPATDRVKLNVRIEGRGTVWVRNAELLRGPLAK